MLLSAMLLVTACAKEAGNEANGHKPTATAEIEATESAMLRDATNTPAQAAPTDTPPPPTPTEETSKRIAPAAPGASAEHAGVRVTLNEIVDPWFSQNIFMQPDPGRRYVAFDVTIEYTGVVDYPHLASSLNFHLSDAEDFAYESAIHEPDPPLRSTELYIGQKTRGWIAFQVNEVTPLKILKYETEILTTTFIEFHFE